VIAANIQIVKINVQKETSKGEMNISPADASKAPYASSGEVVDRMQVGGNGGAKKGLFDSPAKKSASESASGELKKKPAKKISSKNDEVKKDESSSEEEAGEPQESTNADAKGDASAKPEVKKRRARKKWKKPRDKPNRPLSAYNLFFQKERASMLGEDAKEHEAEKGQKRVHRKTHGKIGFAEMARIIGAKWKTLNDEEKKEFTEVAAKEKKRYADELAVWKEEQKQKEQAAKKNAKGSRGPKHDDVKDESGLAPEQEMQIRMQMMANSTRGGFPFMGNDAQPTIGYLRAMQGERAAMFGGGGVGSNPSQQQFSNASEASANALLNQFQGMPPAAIGMDVSGSGGMSDFQQFQMARMQMMNSSSMIGGPMGVGMMGGMGMGGGFPPMGDLEFQRFQHLRMMQGMNQMDGSNSGMSGSNNTNQSSAANMDAAMMRRFQNRFGGM
jgi:hypothetical protein